MAICGQFMTITCCHSSFVSYPMKNDFNRNRSKHSEEGELSLNGPFLGRVLFRPRGEFELLNQSPRGEGYLCIFYILLFTPTCRVSERTRPASGFGLTVRLGKVSSSDPSHWHAERNTNGAARACFL